MKFVTHHCFKYQIKVSFWNAQWLVGTFKVRTDIKSILILFYIITRIDPNSNCQVLLAIVRQSCLASISTLAIEVSATVHNKFSRVSSAKN